MAEGSAAEHEAVEDLHSLWRFTWTIQEFSLKTNRKQFYSNLFTAGGHKWRLLLFPKGNEVDQLSIYLDITDYLPSGCTRYAQFSLAVVNQMNNMLTIKKDTHHQFRNRVRDWGFTSFMPVNDLYDPSSGFLLDDTCIIEVDINTWKTDNTPVKKLVIPPQPTIVTAPQSDVTRVQGYMVNNNIAPVLEDIFKKHGDIAAACVFKLASTRSSLLESVCEVVKRIEASDLTTIDSDMEEIESQVSVLEAAKINVSWLQAHKEAIRKRKEAKKNSLLLKETIGTTVLVKRAAQKDLNERSTKLIAAQKGFEKAERCVKVLDLVENKLSNNILEAKAEKDSWVKRVL